MFLGALSLRAGVPAARLAAAVGAGGELAVRDAGGSEDLGSLGFVLQAQEPWMLRPPGPVDAAPACRVDVVAVRGSGRGRAVERTSVEGFTGATTTWLGTVHPPAPSLRPGLTLLLARLDGQLQDITAASDGEGLNVGGVAAWPRPPPGVGARLTAPA